MRDVSGRVEAWAGAAREWLRGVMPRVALAAVVLVVLRLALRGSWLYRETPLRHVGRLALAVCLFVAAYYVLRLLVRLKRALLWRVRRRLVVTYLFVGLTPIVLLLMLGFLAALGGSSQAMMRVVAVQRGATERQALESARALAALLAGRDAPAERATQAWLDERTALLQGALPGARVSVWRHTTAAYDALTPGRSPARYASAPADEARRGVGHDRVEEAREPLPDWLEGREEWSGFAFLPPPDESPKAFGTPSVRALARRANASHEVAVLVTVPVSRALINFYREATGVHVRPYFIDLSGVQRRDPKTKAGFTLSDNTNDAFITGPDGRRRQIDLAHDQFGDQMPAVSAVSFSYPVFTDATNWQTGQIGQACSFIVDWSWAEGGKQFWSGEALGSRWWQALYIVAVIFLLLEITAVLSAAWMTRAVTGTVHKLYRATEQVKRGDFSHRIRTRSRDQLGELAVAFNDMSADIESLLAERVEHERLKREVEIAHEVQAQLFPRGVPPLEGAELTGDCRAARGVAGDYYDFIEVAPGLVVFALGDVSGKGLSAALVMSNLQAALRAQAAIISERLRLGAQAQAPAAAAAAGGDGDEAAGQMPCGVTGVDTRCAVSNMVEALNTQLCLSTESNRFATLFLALYDARSRRLRYTNAGHNAPLLVRASGEVERLTEGGMMVGAFDWATFEEAEASLAEDDVLVVFSDGLSEARHHDGEEYGEERLAELLLRNRHETAANVRGRIFDQVDMWTGSAEREDDQTVVVLKAVNRES
jgi:sigma-B regulation protein RsbU (phosphoserine phosphatase)